MLLQNSSFPPIVAAAFEGHRSVVKTLLEYGDDPNRASSAGGMTALICAAMRGYTDTIQLLLDYHADPNQRDDVSAGV